MPIDLNRNTTPFRISACKSGFTLIEISIVLVIIGLIVGGILVGQDLIKAATLRAQVSQLEKYNTAVNTFRSKYNALPGDISSAHAASFGFVARAGGLGNGDENGILEAYRHTTGFVWGWNLESETLYFWEDLSAARMIEGTFNTATDADPGMTVANLKLYIPEAKVPNAYIYVYSGCSYSPGYSCSTPGMVGMNLFALSAIGTVQTASARADLTDGALSVMQAYLIDKKIDDGFPARGNIIANYPSAVGTPGPGWAPNGATASSTTCYDTSSGTPQYSITYSGGALMNCSLSAKFQ